MASSRGRHFRALKLSPAFSAARSLLLVKFITCKERCPFKGRERYRSEGFVRWGGGRACFSRSYLGLFRGRPPVPRPQVPGLPLRKGRGLEGGIFWRFLATFSTNFTSETPGTTISPKSPLLWPRGWVTSPGKPPEEQRGQGKGQRRAGVTQHKVSLTPSYTHPLPGLSHSLHPLHPQPRRSIPELTAWCCTERVKQKWKKKAKTGLGTPHPNSSGLRDCLSEWGLSEIQLALDGFLFCRLLSSRTPLGPAHWAGQN